jgi:hypothetical protein
LLRIYGKGPCHRPALLIRQHRKVGFPSIPGIYEVFVFERKPVFPKMAVGERQAVLVRLAGDEPPDLLWRGVCRCEDAARTSAFDNLGQAAVSDFDAPADQQQILGFDIAVLDLQAVQVIKPLAASRIYSCSSPCGMPT